MASIVQVNVSQQIAPTPLSLQQTGALISQGATSTSVFTSSLLTQLSDLTPLLTGAKTVATMTLSGGVVTATAATAHGFTIGDTLLITIAGVTPAGYNGTFLCTVTTSTAFTFPLAVSPGSVTIQGMYTPEDVAELLGMATTFFSQGSNQSVYVLELGPGNANDGVTALNTYITANPNSSYTAGAIGYFYGYTVPRGWDANTSFLGFLAQFNSTTAKTYFWVTTTLATYSLYTNLMKCVIATIESPAQGTWAANAGVSGAYSAGIATVTTTAAHGVVPGQWFQLSGFTPTTWNGYWQALPGTTGTALLFAPLAALATPTTVQGTLLPSYYANAAIPSTEFSAAALFYVALHYKPGATNKVAPYAFQYVYGVTPFPTRGLNALSNILKAAAINVIGTGAEGGISNTIILWGTTMDCQGFTYWYSVDWIQITIDESIANAIINGSNNPINPLYYNQPGINRLVAVAMRVVTNGVRFGLILWPPTQTALDGPVLGSKLDAGDYDQQSVVNAIPFVTYAQENPGEYKIGRYAGLSIIYTPQLGFTNIVFNVLVTEFVVG